jgi:hypothetical protein
MVNMGQLRLTVTIADALDQLIEGATKPADDGPDGDDDGTAGGARRTG